MKKVARMRISPNNLSEEMSNNMYSQHSNSEPPVRTTGRIKKPKAVFDPSDNYLPRSQRIQSGSTTHHSHHNSTTSSAFERRASSTKSSSTISPSGLVEIKDACVVCKKKESKRPVFANKNPLISCSDCQKKVHKLCLKVDFEDFERLQSQYVCDQCSNCRICNMDFHNCEDDIITCSKCAKSFHIHCFPTKIIKTEGLQNWKCNKCQIYNQITNGTTLPVKKIREIIGGGEPSHSTNLNKSNEKVSSAISDANNGISSSTVPSVQKRSIEDGITRNDDIKNEDKNDTNGTTITPPPEKRTKTLNQSSETVSVESSSLQTPVKSSATNICYSPNENFDDNDIPDVKEWSVEQVYEYFSKHFPKEAHVFKDEEIDGRSLLLLKRSDVVKKLPIKLGPSLRIYSLILKIQAQLNDPTLGWNCGL